jgi:Protein of unknown function (DUF1236)
MRRVWNAGTIAIALAAGIGVATAAASLNLTQQQKQTVQQSLSSAKEQAMPSGFTASIGAKVPGSVSLQALPSNVTSKISSLKSNEYAKFSNNEIILVDSKDRQVVAVIQ